MLIRSLLHTCLSIMLSDQTPVVMVGPDRVNHLETPVLHVIRALQLLYGRKFLLQARIHTFLEALQQKSSSGEDYMLNPVCIVRQFIQPSHRIINDFANLDVKP